MEDSLNIVEKPLDKFTDFQRVHNINISQQDAKSFRLSSRHSKEQS